MLIDRGITNRLPQVARIGLGIEGESDEIINDSALIDIGDYREIHSRCLLPNQFKRWLDVLGAHRSVLSKEAHASRYTPNYVLATRPLEPLPWVGCVPLEDAKLARLLEISEALSVPL
jgi:hypothetical protein